MSKILLAGEAREKILSGAQKIADVVKLTLGPKGRNVIINRQNNTPLVTNDGVTIAREVVLDDPYENLGAGVLIQASLKTNEKAGDGTTSAIVFANELLRLAQKQISLGAAPVHVKDGIITAANFICEHVKKSARKVNKYSQIRAVATNSCASSVSGKLVADAITRVGKDGVVLVEQNQTGITTLEFREGLEIALEQTSPYFETTYSDTKLLIIEQAVNSVKELVPLLENIARNNDSIVIVAQDFHPDVISALVLNHVRGGLRVIALKSVRAGTGLVTDMAKLTGATVISRENGIGINEITDAYLGFCDKIICGTASAKIVAKGGENTQNHINDLREQIRASVDEYERSVLQKRLARLTTGIAVISVGSATDIERGELKLRIDDAVCAATVAMRDGIVEGAGLAYIRAGVALEKYIKKLPVEITKGAEVVLDSLPVILRQICLNSGFSFDIVIHKIKSEKLIGFDAMTGKYTNMFVAQIVDPACVVMNVVQNAASVVSTLLTTEGIIINNAG